MKKKQAKAPSGNNPLVSFVIIGFNRKDDLLAVMKSIHSQSYPQIETIIVDNKSTDDSLEVVKKKYPAVRIIRLHKNYGLTAFNIGVENARGDYVALIDNDVEFNTSWVHDIMEKFNAEPESTAAVSTKVVQPGMDQAYIESPKVNRERYMATFRGCGTVFKKDIYKRAGGFDDDLFLYVGERDLTARVLQLGCRIKQYPKVSTFHKVPFGIRISANSTYYRTRNFIWYCVKYCSISDMLRLGVNMFKKIVGLNKSRDYDATGSIGFMHGITKMKGGYFLLIKAIGAGFLGIPRALRKRKVVRAKDFKVLFDLKGGKKHGN